MTDSLPDTLVDTPATQADSRWSVLAGLRFLLAMVVVAGHLAWFSPESQPPLFLRSLGGTAAVIGFLLVSGYSIAHSLERRPIGFFRRRVLRIYPLYVVATLYALVPFLSGASALITPGITIPRPHTLVVVANLFMLQNLVCPPVDSNMVLWTLGVEILCYLLAPVFRKSKTIYLLILIILSGGAFGCYPRMGFEHYSTLLFGLPFMMFVWAWVCGFLIQRYRNSPWVGICVAVFGMVLMLINTTYPAPYSAYTVAGTALLLTLAPRIPVAGRIRPLLKYLGDLSYPIYLFHLPTFLLWYCIMEVRNRFGLLFIAYGVCAAFLFIESIAKQIFSAGRSRGTAS